MIAKNDYYLDENGKVTTDPEKGARRLVRKGSTVGAVIEKRYGFVGGEPTSKDPQPLNPVIGSPTASEASASKKSSVTITKKGNVGGTNAKTKV